MSVARKHAPTKGRRRVSRAAGRGFCDVHGQAIRGIRPIALNQERGILQPTPESGLRTTGFPVGTLLRVLPHHACSTAAQFDGYHVISDAPGAAPYWPRFRGW